MYFYHSSWRRVPESSKRHVYFGLCRRETRSDTNVNHSRELASQEFFGSRVSGGGGGLGGMGVVRGVYTSVYNTQGRIQLVMYQSCFQMQIRVKIIMNAACARGGGKRRKSAP